MDADTIVVLEGDQTGQELLEEALRVLSPDVIGIDLDLPRFDLSLESRRATRNAVVHEAAAAVREHGLGIKAATITPEGAGDVGSPNRILREEIGGRVIVRTGRRIPGVVPLGGVHAPISVVRMAVGDAYGAKEWREGEGEHEVAFRTERIERRICRAVAEFSFRLAERTGAKVFGGPKYTVSPTYEGMLKEEMDAAASRHPDVRYEPQLIDATFALLVASALGVGNAITLEAGLAFLGLGVPAPAPSWGNMISAGRDVLINAPWVATFPGLAIVLSVIGCNLLADGLRDVLDPQVVEREMGKGKWET